MSYFYIPFRIQKRRRQQSEGITFKNWLAVIGASLAAFMAVLDIQVTNASLKEIQNSLNLDLTDGGWISTSYLISETIMIPLTGYLSNAFGIRRFVLWNCFIFIVSSMLCGMSWNIESLILFRCIQGFSGGALVPMAFQILLIFIPQEKRYLSMVIFGLTATMAPTIGPSLGGWLTENYGWRYIFYINLLPGLLMIFLIYKGVNGSKIDWEKLRKIDLLGIITLSLGLGSLIYLLEEGAKKNWFENSEIRLTTIISTISLTIFIVIQLKRKNPLLNLGVLIERNFFITSVVTMISGAALYGGIYALSLYLSEIQSYQPSQIGKVIMWLGIPQLVVMPFLPFLIRYINLKTIAIFGILLFAYSNYLNCFMSYNYSGEDLKLSLFLRAIGQPLFMIPISIIGMSFVSHETAGNASAIFNMLRNIGGSIGISLVGTFLINKKNIHLENINYSLQPDSSLLGEYIQNISYTARKTGLDFDTANAYTQKLIETIIIRDSYIKTFNDIFFLLSGSLCLLTIFVMYFKIKNNLKLDQTAFE